MGVLDSVVQPFLAGMNVLVLGWLFVNASGMLVSYVAMRLSLGDRRRAELGRRQFEYQRGGISKTRRSIMILGAAAAQAEIYRLVIHTGHAVIGVIAAGIPRPANEEVREWVLAASLWLIFSSLMTELATIRHLKARCDYRMMRLHGRMATWREAVRQVLREFRYEMSRRRAK